MNENSLGKTLRTARRRVRLSQTVVGKHLDLTRQTIGSFERDERTPGLAYLVVMANLYRLTIDELLGGARSVVRPKATVQFHARTNLGGAVTADDIREVQSFAEYLRGRSGRHPSIGMRREMFQSVDQFVDRWRNTKEAVALKTVPVPVFEYVAKLGIEVRFTAMDDLAGALIPGDDNHPAGMLINSDQPADRERWTCAHEIAHLVLGHDPHEQKCETGRRFSPIEVQADQFAGELLMPSAKIPEEARKAAETLTGRANVRTAHHVLLLSKRFLVSYQAMLVRLGQLGSLPPDEVDALHKEKPAKLAMELGLAEGRGSAPFDPKRLPHLVAKSMPDGWHAKADAEAVRMLQTIAYGDYVASVPEAERADGAAEVYEQVALWVARTYPIVRL